MARWRQHKRSVECYFRFTHKNWLEIVIYYITGNLKTKIEFLLLPYSARK